MRARTPFSTKVKVGAAFGIGILVGSAGLATAGALPGPAQGVAHTVLSTVGVHVPGGPQRYDGPECGGTYKNHGQYVRSHTQDPDAGQSRCGKPIQAGTGSDSTDGPDTPGNSSGSASSNSSGHSPGNSFGSAPGNGHGNTKSHGHAGKGGDKQSGELGGPGFDDSGLARTGRPINDDDRRLDTDHYGFERSLLRAPISGWSGCAP